MKLSNFRNFQETIDYIDDACNGTGLLNSLIELQKELRDNNLVTSTDEKNTHAVTRYFLQKLIDLSGAMPETSYYVSAYDDLKVFSKILMNTKLLTDTTLIEV